MRSKVLIVAVHPDDETLGCGGTLLKHKAKGDEIYWLICTSLPKNHSYYEKREEEIKKVASLYNFDGVYNLEFETMRVDEYSMSELIGKISNVINEIKPNIIYLPFKMMYIATIEKFLKRYILAQKFLDLLLLKEF